MSARFQYYRVQKSRREYKGERYFRYHPNHEQVTQVCVYPGEVKKGRGNLTGVYLMDRGGFVMNWMAPPYLEPITKSTYDKNFNKVISFLL